MFTRSEIVEMVKNKFPNDEFSTTSVIPSDYCYNLLNYGKINDPKLLEFNIFEYVDKNTYVYLGENYPYNKDILHRPKGGKPYKIGHRINGQRIIGSRKDYYDKEKYEKPEINKDTIQHNTPREPAQNLDIRYYKETILNVVLAVHLQPRIHLLSCT